MKNFIFIIVIIFLILVGLYPEHIKDFKDFAIWLKDNFTYQAEELNVDFWKNPKQTLRDKGGDCEDLALLATTVLRDMRYKCWFVAVITDKPDGTTGGHAITIVKHSNGYSFFSNTRYYITRHKDIKTLLDNNYPTWTRIKFCWLNKFCPKQLLNPNRKGK